MDGAGEMCEGGPMSSQCGQALDDGRGREVRGS